MVPFKYLNTLSNTAQWELSRLCVYFPNLSTTYAISNLEKFVKCNEELIIWEYLWEEMASPKFLFNLIEGHKALKHVSHQNNWISSISSLHNDTALK